MASGNKPNRGPVVLKAGGLGTIGEAELNYPANVGRTSDGTWRRDTKFTAKHGIRIVMRKEHGLTDKVLVVPLRFQAPVLNSLHRVWQFTWATYDTIRVGQKSRPGGKQLMTLDVDTMLMNADALDSSSGVAVWVTDPFPLPDPQRLLTELRHIAGLEPHSTPELFRLTLTDPRNYGSDHLVNMVASLTAISATQNPGEPGVEYVTLSFQQWSQDDETKQKQRPGGGSDGGGQSTVTLGPGDTLYELAKNSHFHAASAWQKIAKANGITGVSPGSADELAKWAKKHHKTTLAIPALPARGARAAYYEAH